MTPAHELANALHARCVFAFQEDIDTEIGKVHRSKTNPHAWIFFVYVMQDDGRQRTVKRSNIVAVSDRVSEVVGPDELVIAKILKEPVL